MIEAAFRPGRLRRLLEQTKRAASFASAGVGRCISWAVLVVLYLVVFAPVGIAVRLLSDPLRLKNRPTAEGLWCNRPARSDDMEAARRQS